MTSITFVLKHEHDFGKLLQQAVDVANIAISGDRNRCFSTTQVRHIRMPSEISQETGNAYRALSNVRKVIRACVVIPRRACKANAGGNFRIRCLDNLLLPDISPVPYQKLHRLVVDSECMYESVRTDIPLDDVIGAYDVVGYDSMFKISDVELWYPSTKSLTKTEYVPIRYYGVDEINPMKAGVR